MILFSAEAILASSTSKFGIWIPLTDDEDCKSSTETTISTSLIHCIASVGICEQIHTSVLNLIFQQANVAGGGNLSECRSEILQSLLVSTIILQTVSLTGDDWIFGWRSRLASLILNWCSILILLRRWWVNRFWYSWTPWIQFMRIRCCRGRNWICNNISRKTMRVPNAWRPVSAARHSKRTACIPSGIGWGGNDTGRLVTWEFPIDSASWKSLESFIQLISCCKSCILPVSSKIVSWSSTYLRLAIVSKVELWNFLNSSISLRLFSWASRRSQFCFINCSWRSCWSRRWRSSAWARRSSSRCDSITSPNFRTLLRW